MKYVIGIDEVGRGALAGPVVVSAVAIPHKIKFKNLKDSKRLTPKGRERWFKFAKGNPDILYSIGRVYQKGVDRLNIARAANLAAHRATSSLFLNYKLSVRDSKLFLDGGLFILNKNHQRDFLLRAKTIIGGDEKINCIKLASIIAKVTRDRYMLKMHKRHPEYGFDVHKGYGTRVHGRAIKRHGLSRIHRLTFTKRYNKLHTNY